MEGGEDTKVETVMCERFKAQKEEEEEEGVAEARTASHISSMARRRFMITDILNSSLERRAEAKVAEGGPGAWAEQGLDMRLLFPRLPLNLQQGPGKLDQETESDNDNEDENDHEGEKGKIE